jgi:VWFA-related protein
MKALPLALALAGAVHLAALGQDQPATTFRSAIDLVRVDVNVLDRDGRPVPGLGPGDFAVTVDGRPRTVVTADYVPASAGPAPDGAAARHFSTNAGAGGGRLVMFVVDQASIGTGRARQTTTAAEQFISRLNPSDRVGLVTVPTMDQIDFTSDHAVVRERLTKLVGSAAPAIALREIGVSESLAIARGDERAIAAALSRECRGLMTDLERRMCRQEILTNASIVYAETRDRALSLLSALRSVLQRFTRTPEPKTVIVISGGLVLEQDYAQFSWFAQLVARAQATIYTIFILGPQFEASLQRMPVQYREDVTLAEDGLSHITDLGKGSLFRLSTDPEPIFNRIALELSGYYLLGFEADDADREDRPHRLKVEVPRRSGIEVRARREFSAATTAVQTVEALLSETMRATLPASDIRLKATTYTLREPDGALRILVGSEIERARNTAGRIALAYALYDAQGQLVGSLVEPDVSTRVNPRTGAHQHFGSIPAGGPGSYTLKVAVVDDLRRRGSVEHRFRAQLVEAGPLRGADLLLAEAGTSAPGEAEPVVSADYTSDVVHALIELYADAPEALERATVAFEVAEHEDGRAINSVPGVAALHAAASPTARSLQAAIPIGLLPPGEYVARAVIAADGREVGRVARPFRVARAVVTSRNLPAMLPSRLDAFDRKAVLAEDVVGFFLDRMAERQTRASEAALGFARGGQFDALLAELKTAEGHDLASSFLGGLALYARGELNAAMARFRQALKADSEFFPAAFYLGACYAAGGDDRQAANAWQTALVTEDEAPFIYPLIADAMVRDRNVAGAVGILEEAAGRWPDNDALQVRLGIAYAMARRMGDAIRTLDPYLANHPEDHGTLFALLRGIYEARTAGKTIESPERDRAIFARYAEAYAAAGGPNQALVDRWKKFLAR